MTINSIVKGIPNRAYRNVVKAFFRDPLRPIHLLDFLTIKEREILLFTSLGDVEYEKWIDKIVKKAVIGDFDYE